MPGLRHKSRHKKSEHPRAEAELSGPVRRNHGVTSEATAAHFYFYFFTFFIFSPGDGTIRRRPDASIGTTTAVSSALISQVTRRLRAAKRGNVGQLLRTQARHSNEFPYKELACDPTRLSTWRRQGPQEPKTGAPPLPMGRSFQHCFQSLFDCFSASLHERLERSPRARLYHQGSALQQHFQLP
jgi:hypothetical protein